MVERLAGLLRLPIHQMSGDACLDIDHRDVMREHVVQFPGDPQSFVTHPAARLLLPRLLCATRPFLDGGDVGAAVAHRIGQGDRQGAQGGDRDRSWV